MYDDNCKELLIVAKPKLKIRKATYCISVRI